MPHHINMYTYALSMNENNMTWVVSFTVQLEMTSHMMSKEESNDGYAGVKRLFFLFILFIELWYIKFFLIDRDTFLPS